MCYLRCTHTYHADCVKKWLEKNGKCPVCKQNAMWSVKIKLLIFHFLRLPEALPFPVNDSRLRLWLSYWRVAIILTPREFPRWLLADFNPRSLMLDCRLATRSCWFCRASSLRCVISSDNRWLSLLRLFIISLVDCNNCSLACSDSYNFYWRLSLYSFSCCSAYHLS